MGAEQKAQTAMPPGFTLQSAIHLLAKAELFEGIPFIDTLAKSSC
jgi:hypothetical protein